MFCKGEKKKYAQASQFSSVKFERDHALQGKNTSDQCFLEASQTWFCITSLNQVSPPYLTVKSRSKKNLHNTAVTLDLHFLCFHFPLRVSLTQLFTHRLAQHSLILCPYWLAKLAVALATYLAQQARKQVKHLMLWHQNSRDSTTKAGHQQSSHGCCSHPSPGIKEVSSRNSSMANTTPGTQPTTWAAPPAWGCQIKPSPAPNTFSSPTPFTTNHFS